MAESREQRAESREQRAENNSSRGFKCQESKADKDSKLHNGQREQRYIQCSIHRNRNCYCNYKKVFKIDVQIGMAVLARDYKGFGSGLIPSNGVIVETI